MELLGHVAAIRVRREQSQKESLFLQPLNLAKDLSLWTDPKIRQGKENNSISFTAYHKFNSSAKTIDENQFELVCNYFCAG